MVTKREFADLVQRVDNQENIIKSLQQHITRLDKKIIELTSEKALSSHVNDVLSEKLDSVSQYTRRSCVVVEGIPVANGESIEDIEKLAVNAVVKLGFTKENVENEIDKTHRVGPIYEGKK